MPRFFGLRVHNSTRPDLCEWDPDMNQPARYTPGTDEYYGCTNKAALIVGANGQWRLCESCAALPKFNRFRRREPIRRGETT